MKNLYQILYGVAGLLFVIVILGGTVTRPIFNNFSTRTIETAGVKKASIDSLDSRVDDMLFGLKKIQLQIDKIKNIFSDKDIDQSKYQRVKHEVFVRNIYDPINGLVIIFYRIGFFFITVILLLSAVIIQLIFRSKDLRSRVEKLESKLLNT